ncbi:MAG: efflux RND transporter periplasmic adaptor subunit [Verrucomicrobiota bacterium]
MDRPIDPAVRNKARWLKRIAGAALVTALGLYLVLRDGRSAVKMDIGRLTLAHARIEEFHDYVTVIGYVEPIQTVYLDATEGGKVEEIFLREGTRVAKGDDILRISNDNLALQISNYETEVARATNDLKSMLLTLDNQKFANESQLIQYKYELIRLEREMANNEVMIKSRTIPSADYHNTRETHARISRLRDLLEQKTATDAVTFAARITAAQEMLESMQKNLAANRARLGLLRVKAPVNGELATLNPELGQVIPSGARIGTVNILDSYKLKAEVDEHYVGRIRPKLKASCEFAGKDYPAAVAKIYPEVRGGSFAVDLVFEAAIPAEIRIGQTAKTRLALGEPGRALVLPRGGFYQSGGGRWIYVVDRATGVAVKRQIQIGRQNPDYYEVLDGLREGEEVIVSGYETLGEADKVLLVADAKRRARAE